MPAGCTASTAARGSTVAWPDRLRISDELTEYPAPLPGVRLTRGEIGVLRMIVAGQSESEIAVDVGVSEKVIAGCRERLFLKTGTTNRAQLLQYARSSGLVPIRAERAASAKRDAGYTA